MGRVPETVRFDILVLLISKGGLKHLIGNFDLVGDYCPSVGFLPLSSAEEEGRTTASLSQERERSFSTSQTMDGDVGSLGTEWTWHSASLLFNKD